MNDSYDDPFGVAHDHVFLGAGHEQNERKTWAVIALCSAMMLIEIIGGHLFGSLALVADGLHMSTHAGAMLIAALAYTYARKYANDPRFVFGTGKLGDLAGYTSAIILAMIALLIGYEAFVRLLSPVPIHFGEAIPIAVMGLLVNVASAWLLSGDDHHGHSHGHAHHDHEACHGDTHRIEACGETFDLSIFEDGVPPVFRIKTDGAEWQPKDIAVTAIRPDGAREVFTFFKGNGYWESIQEIPEPHSFQVILKLPNQEHSVLFEEHDHGGVDDRDHNMRATYIHVIADAAVSVLAIVGLILAREYDWLWMDPVAGVIGSFVIANWSYSLIRDTGSILVDLSPDDRVANRVRAAIDAEGDKLLDLHVWRLGPGHFGAIISVLTNENRDPRFYHAILANIKGVSHISVEVNVHA